MKTEQLIDCEGITLESTKPFAFSCCDCGLKHHMVIVSEDGKPVGFAVKRVATPSGVQPSLVGGENSFHSSGSECDRVQRVELSGDELALFQRTLDGFADCGETETDYETLVNWARRGLLECTNFRPTAAAHRMLAPGASTNQEGNAT